VLWVYRTNKRVPTGETPFSLAYVMKVIPLDISMSTLQVEGVVQDKNALLNLTLNHSEKRRQQAQICIEAYQQQIRSTHYKVKSRKFQVGDLVLKRMIRAHDRTKESWDITGRAPTSSSLGEARSHTPWPIRIGTNLISNGILFT